MRLVIICVRYQLSGENDEGVIKPNALTTGRSSRDISGSRRKSNKLLSRLAVGSFCLQICDKLIVVNLRSAAIAIFKPNRTLARCKLR